MLLDADEGEEALMIGSEGIGVFGDVRRGERGAWLFDRIVATGSLVLRTVGGNRAEEIAAHRFLDSPRVSAAEIIETLGRRTGERCCGRHSPHQWEDIEQWTSTKSNPHYPRSAAAVS
jgi:hypothetical protein